MGAEVTQAGLGTLAVASCGLVWLVRTQLGQAAEQGAVEPCTRGDETRLRESAELLACTSRHWCCFDSLCGHQPSLRRGGRSLACRKLQQLSCCPPAQEHEANSAVTPRFGWPLFKTRIYVPVTVLWVELLLMLCIIDTQMLNTKK